jgi:hypothetical protein
VVELPYAADCRPCVEKLRAVLPSQRGEVRGYKYIVRGGRIKNTLSRPAGSMSWCSKWSYNPGTPNPSQGGEPGVDSALPLLPLALSLLSRTCVDSMLEVNRMWLRYRCRLPHV